MTTAKKSSGKQYGALASATVEREMKAMKEGKLKSGGSGKKVTNPKQAIAIALSEARRAGGKVPGAPAKAAPGKAAAKKTAAKKTAAKKTPAKKTAAKKTAARRSPGTKNSSQ